MPALDLALGHRVIGLAPGMRPAVVIEPGSQLGRDIAWTVIAEQPRPLLDVDAVQAGGGECISERGRDVRRAHGLAQAPGDNIAGEVVRSLIKLERFINIIKPALSRHALLR